mmetsp:Transcript_18771/g.47946  ORF Transcript_18771/g.47946 Transcript_18771/m.47946 type:complete len:209 (-) Transcript_18771:353-979(-)
MHADGHFEFRFFEHIRELARAGHLLGANVLVVELILEAIECLEEAGLIEPKVARRCRAGESADIGEQRHLPSCIQCHSDATCKVNGSLKQRLTACAAFGIGAIRDIDRLTIPRRRKLVGKIEAIEEDAVDERGVSERWNDLLDEEITHRLISHIPDRVPAAVSGWVGIAEAHLLARRHGIDGHSIGLQHPICERFIQCATWLVIRAAV